MFVSIIKYMIKTKCIVIKKTKIKFDIKIKSEVIKLKNKINSINNWDQIHCNKKNKKLI